MKPTTSSGNPIPMLPAWVAAACLGAGLLAAPGCGGKKEKEIQPPPGLETALKKPADTAMEPELESTDPMDPVPGQLEPPPATSPPPGSPKEPTDAPAP